MDILVESQFLEEQIDSAPPIPCCNHIAGNVHYLTKALTLQQESSWNFDVTIDLEDGSKLGSEQEFLNSLGHVLAPFLHDARIGMRVHPFGHEFLDPTFRVVREDLLGRLAFLLVPKTEGVAELVAFRSFVEHCLGGPDLTPPFHVLIESPQAVEEVFEIAALSWVESLDFGIMDLVSRCDGMVTARALESPLQFDHAIIQRAKTRLVAAAARYGKIATHNVTIAFSDHQQTYADAYCARANFGFQRMWSIHPSQIEPICRAFSPDAAEVTRAKAVLAHAAEHEWGPISYQGKLYDRASYRLLRAVLVQHAASRRG